MIIKLTQGTDGTRLNINMGKILCYLKKEGAPFTLVCAQGKTSFLVLETPEQIDSLLLAQGMNVGSSHADVRFDSQKRLADLEQFQLVEEMKGNR